MNQYEQVSFKPLRFYLIVLVITLCVMGLVWRVFDLAILDQPFLRHQGDERVIRVVSRPAFRGMIVDRNQFPLAVSTTVFSVWMNPNELTVPKKELKALAAILKLPAKSISALINRYKKQHREFIYLKRALSPEAANQIKSLKLRGIYLQKDYRRYYPEGEVTAHIIGFTNIDDQGQEGLELAYNNWLQGEKGKKKVIKDRMGRVISDVGTLSLQKSGQNLILSIDRRIQYLAYRELLAGIFNHHARSGSVVVLDVKTGEILAMVNQPSFNPNNRLLTGSDNYRNRAVTDVFEPGSTIKAFSIFSALDSGQVTTNTVVDTNPGWLKVGRNVVNDDGHNYGELTVAGILQKSSNVGVTKLILTLPKDQLWSLLHRVGFGEPTGINFPGEQTGSLIKHHPWGDFVLATMSWGYGLSVTPLQLARGYAVIAHKGMKLPVSLLRVDKPPAGEQVMGSKVAEQMLLLLESVVNNKEGTGKLASVPGYRVAGKTGTSKKAGNHGYEKGVYTASFVGIAPVSDPRLVVAVIIHEPQGKDYYGATVSAPVFERIMEGALRLLGVPMDEPKAFAGSASIDDTKPKL